MPSLPWQHEVSRSAYVEHLRAIRVTDREIAAILRDAAADTERLVNAALSDPSPNVSTRVRRAQWASSVEALRTAQAELWGTVTTATREGIERATRAATAAEADLLSILLRAVDENALGGPAQAEIILGSMRNAAMLAVNDVRSRVINAIPLSDRVYNTRALSERWVDRTVNRGIARGASAREIARDVRHLIRPDVRGGVSYAAHRLARTEINNAFHGTEVRQAQELPWIEAMKWEISGSHPRFDECDELAEGDHDNLGPGVFKKANVPGKPHPNCLCYTTVVTVAPDEFNNRLLSGEYDGWLRDQGFMGMRDVA